MKICNKTIHDLGFQRELSWKVDSFEVKDIIRHINIALAELFTEALDVLGDEGEMTIPKIEGFCIFPHQLDSYEKYDDEGYGVGKVIHEAPDAQMGFRIICYGGREGFTAKMIKGNVEWKIINKL